MPRVKCSELAATIARLAFNIGARPGVNGIDGVVAEITKHIPELNRGEVVKAINEATAGHRRVLTDAQAAVADLKREAKSDAGLRAKIANLQTNLETGTLPVKGSRVDRSTEALKILRDIRDDVAAQVRRSDPAVQDRLLKQIDSLTERLESTGFAPPEAKADPVLSKQAQELSYQKARLQKQIRAKINALKPQGIWGWARQPSDFFKTIRSSLDQSAVLRQAGPLVLGSPRRLAGTTVAGYKSLSDRAFHRIQENIKSKPSYDMKVASGLYFADMDAAIASREEAMASRVAGKIPGVGASQRSYNGSLNWVRDEAWDMLASTVARDGSPTMAEAKVISNYINVASGRGVLGPADGARNFLNSLFFSPSYHLARFQYAVGQPIWTGLPSALASRRFGAELAATGRVRAAIAKEYTKTLAGLAVVYTLATMGGDSVETDPRSSDFGKLKSGNTRQDVLMGIGQQITLLSRLVSGTTKNSKGKIVPIRGDKVPYGQDRAGDLIFRFLRQKLGPVPGAAIDLAEGQNAIGEKVTPAQVGLGLVTPLGVHDVMAVLKDQGALKGVLKEIFSFHGAGLQHYQPKK